MAHKITIPATLECIASIYQEHEIMEDMLLVRPIPGVAERYFLTAAASVDHANQKLSTLPDSADITPMEGRPGKNSDKTAAREVSSLNKAGTN